MPDTDTNKANPVRPAGYKEKSANAWGSKVLLTRSDAPFCLETSDAGETSHGEEVEEDLRGVEDDGWLGYYHLKLSANRVNRTGKEVIWRINDRKPYDP
jgi:hypothetical protein